MKKNLLLTICLLTTFLVCAVPVCSQTINVKGKVVDADNGEPLIGATVKVKNSAKGDVTDLNGNFTLAEIGSNAILEVQYVGYQKSETSVNGQKFVEIRMSEDSKSLNEVVVVGYGTMDKKELTSSIAHVGEKDFLVSSSIDPVMMIQGKAPGVSITNTGAGDPNNQASIQIRGVSSRAAGLGPLIVIDGVPGGNLTNLNANDIASFDILKDGAASAIYGTRGSNGVILITTKHGSRDGQIHTSYLGNVAANIPVNELDMLGAAQYRELRAPTNYGVDLGGNDDWYDAVSRTGWTTQHTATLSGGNDMTNYRASVDYRNANGIDRYSNREEYGGRAAIWHTTRGGLFTFNVNIAPRLINRNIASWDVFRRALETNPTTPIYDNNNPSRYTSLNGQIAGNNPVEQLYIEDNSAETKLLDWDGNVKLNLLPLLMKKEQKYSQTLTTQLSFANHEASNFYYFFRPSTSTMSMRNGYTGEGSRTYQKSSERILEWITNYTGSFDGHNIKGMFGYSYQYIKNQGMAADNKNFPNDGLGANSLGTGTWALEDGNVGMSSYKNDSKLIAFFGRLSYDWQRRYLLTASLRHEGSSKFGANHKWGNFPAISLGWRVSEEPFMKEINWIDDLKIRGDYGETGNQDFDSYLSLNTMNGFGYYYYQGKYYQVWGAGKNVNPDLHWEKAKNWNIGLDFALFGNKLSGSIDYYNRKQQDLLGDYNVPVPPYLHDKTFVNVGSMRNSGFEFNVHYAAVNTKNFTYAVDFVGATLSNKFLDFSNSEYTGENYYDVCNTEDPYPMHNLQRIQKGERLGNFFLYRYAGIDQNGNFLIYDKDNQLKLASKGTEEDKAIVGNGLPKFTASMTHTFRYYDWDLSVFLRGAFDYSIFNIHDFYYGIQGFNGNVMEKAYSKNGLVTGLQVPTDYYLERGDYIKLDMVSLGYTWRVNKRYLDSVKFKLTGKNLVTFTKYSGIDPANVQVNGLTPGATGSRSYYPSVRQVIFGVQLDF